MPKSRDDAIAGPRSRRAFAAACRHIPGGVNSPVRAWKRLGGNPPVIVRGQGSRITDVAALTNALAQDVGA